jgi:RNA polymerase sigma factor (sigma-70 family)
MQEIPDQVARIDEVFKRIREGDASARGELFEYAWDRLGRLVKYSFRGDKLHRWEQTDDVRQNLSIRLLEALDAVKPASLLHFYRLVNQHIVWTLLDLAKHYYGPHGWGTHYDTDKAPLEGPGPAPREAADFDAERFKKALENLSEEERDVFTLHQLQELPFAEIASLLGLTHGQVKRRFRTAKLKLHEAMGDEAAGL